MSEPQKPKRMPGLVLEQAYGFMADFQKKNAGAKPSFEVVAAGLATELLLELHDVTLLLVELNEAVARSSSPAVPVADVLASITKAFVDRLPVKE